MSAVELAELYQEVILDHFKKPRCYGCLLNPDADVLVNNPLCGDKIQLTLKWSEDGHVRDVGFRGSGCSISQASCSIMSELCCGKTVKELEDLAEIFKGMMRGELTEAEMIQLGDGVALVGVRQFSARVRCAMLAWDALDSCLKGYRSSDNYPKVEK